jgi:cytochrome c oxidase subunit 2
MSVKPRILHHGCLLLVAEAAGTWSGTAGADAPLNYLTGYGQRAYSVLWLTWGMLAISLIVIVVVTALLLGGIFRRRPGVAPQLPGEAPVERPPGGVGWIYVGVGVTTVVLLATMAWTVGTLAHVSQPVPGPAAVHLQVTGHQWWWEVRYLDGAPDQQFVTANEIHIPVGESVEVKLRGADVIHSFWVPALTGKTDAIPGQINKTWLEADRTGAYRGQCGEYCGHQHAHMAFEVVAEPLAAFRRWRAHQLTSALARTAAAQAGENAFLAKCGVCHTVRGTRAGGVLGPDLTHLMSRRTIAAATLPNKPGYLSAWISDPQHIKPGSYMPRLDLSGAELNRIRDYLATLN